ncbi:MAG: translation initiation factor IF-3 [Planctomycetota bacterium]
MNNQIRIRQIRVIGADGGQLGVLETAVAQQMANESGLDLVEIAPNQRPPVCRIMDFGKYKYELKKKEQASRRKQHQTQLKEVRVRPRIAEHDMQVKIRHAREFLEAGDKVQVNCLLRGREIMHQDLALKVMKHVFEFLSDIAKVEREPRLEGKRLVMIVAKK